MRGPPVYETSSCHCYPPIVACVSTEHSVHIGNPRVADWSRLFYSHVEFAMSLQG